MASGLSAPPPRVEARLPVRVGGRGGGSGAGRVTVRSPRIRAGCAADPGQSPGRLRWRRRQPAAAGRAAVPKPRRRQGLSRPRSDTGAGRDGRRRRSATWSPRSRTAAAGCWRPSSSTRTLRWTVCPVVRRMFYRWRTADGFISDVRSAATAMPSARAALAPFRFTMMGDQGTDDTPVLPPGLSAGDYDDSYYKPDNESAAAAHRQRAQPDHRGRNPDFHVLAGDIAYADPSGRGQAGDVRSLGGTAADRASTSSTPSCGTCTWAPSKPARRPPRGCSPLATTTWRPPTPPTATAAIWRGWTSPATGPPRARRCTRSSTATSRAVAWTPTTSATRSPRTRVIRAAPKTAGWSGHWPRYRANPNIDFIVCFFHHCAYSTTAAPRQRRRACARPGPRCSTVIRSIWCCRATTTSSNAPTRSAAGKPTTVAADNAVVYPETDGTVYYTVGCAGRPRYEFQPGEPESYRGNALPDTFVPNSYVWTAAGRPDNPRRSAGRGSGSATTPSFASTCGRGRFVSEMDVVAVDEYGREFDKLTYRRQVRS